MTRRTGAAVFHLVLIKPTHYDDDGYPIRWVKAAIPSNTLAALNSLAEDAVRRRVLGPGVELRLLTFDETNQRVRPQRIIGAIRRAGAAMLVRPGGPGRAVDAAAPGSRRPRGCIPQLPGPFSEPACYCETRSSRYGASSTRTGRPRPVTGGTGEVATDWW